MWSNVGTCGVTTDPGRHAVNSPENSPSERRRQLAAHMNERRRQLRIDWNEVARRAGMTVENLRRIRRGTISVSENAAVQIDEALGWELGSVEAFLAGGVEPQAKAESAKRLRPVNWTTEKEAVFRRIEDFLSAEGVYMEEADLEEAAVRYLQKHNRETPARDNSK